jgi:glutamine amidotransferase
MSVAIIDYGSGNLRSAEKAFSRMAQGRAVSLTSNPEHVAKADHIIVPGVGAFADCYQGLTALSGMREAIEQRVLREGRPLLGICVGMQLLCDRGFENGIHEGLGWIAGDVVPIQKLPEYKIPHMGWNNISITEDHPVLAELDGADMYFVHSYAAQLADPSACYARCDYGQSLPAVIGRDNIIGTQFHPEKSQHAGLHLIQNFLAWCP